MIEFWNVIVALIAGFVSGLVVHSAYETGWKKSEIYAKYEKYDEE